MWIPKIRAYFRGLCKENKCWSSCCNTINENITNEFSQTSRDREEIEKWRHGIPENMKKYDKK